MKTMRRRELLVMAAGAALFGRDALAQATRPARIGVLAESWGPTPAVVGIRDGLRQLGSREDVDFTIGVRVTQGNAASCPPPRAISFATVWM